MDEQGNETFDTSGALDKLRKVISIFFKLFTSYDIIMFAYTTI